MTFIHDILKWWSALRAENRLKRIPGYAKAISKERDCLFRGDMRGLKAARLAKREAIHADLRRAAV